MDEREANQRFLLLVEEFRLAGWIGLGKIKNPQAEDTGPDLGLARHAIDTLSMIEIKTRGNRSEVEERLLRQILADLRLNFADEVKKTREAKSSEAPKPEKGSHEGSDPSAPGGAAGGSDPSPEVGAPTGSTPDPGQAPPGSGA
jgi:hypothetical protein